MTRRQNPRHVANVQERERKAMESFERENQQQQQQRVAGGASGSKRAQIVFTLNGERVELNQVNPLTTLNDYIRTSTRFKGTKLSCGEGGCGACTVVVSRWDAHKNREVHASVNSCLMPIYSVDGFAVTTTEGIGNVRAGFHPIQERLASMNGSQCGFCTPGMVMAMYGYVRRNQDRAVSESDVESMLDGNICRCTGYRPILDAFKSLVPGNTVRDDVFNADLKTDFDPSSEPDLVSHDLRKHRPEQIEVTVQGKKWCRPTSLAAALAAIAKHQNLPLEAVKVCAGNTSVGIYKTDDPLVYIDLARVPELRQQQVTEQGITVGATCTITEFIEMLHAVCSQRAPHEVVSFPVLAEHAYHVGNNHVRNAASIGGNLMLAQKRGFPSDLATILLAVGATVSLAAPSGRVRSNVSFAEFLSAGVPRNGLLYSISVPFTRNNEHFGTFRTANRPQNAHALINSGFRVLMDGRLIREATVVYGVVGPRAVRARRTSEFLVGREINQQTLREAVALLKQEIQPSADPRYGNAEGRQGFISGHFFKFFLGVARQVAADQVSNEAKSASERMVRPPSHATHHLANSSSSSSDENTPVHKPFTKESARVQASGEAQYTGDIAVPPDTLFGAWVLADRAMAPIKRVDLSQAEQQPGYVDFVCYRDVPGENNVAALMGTEEMFVPYDKGASYPGQVVGVVLARTQREARRAAKFVRVEYDSEVRRDGHGPIYTLEDGIEAKAYLELPPFVPTKGKRGDPDAALASSKHRAQFTVNIKGQNHFYMETQTALVSPDESGRMVAWSAAQYPTGAQKAICTVIGLPANKVSVNMRRVGGAFGGKATRNLTTLGSTAVAAHKTQRPVQLTLDRNTDMSHVGGRHEMKADLEIGFEDDGTITACKIVVHLDGGSSLDLSFFVAGAVYKAVEQVYLIPNMSVEVFVIQTNTLPRTSVRGPGEIQASFIIENVIERVAQQLNMSANAVREKNIPRVSESDTPISLAGLPMPSFHAPQQWEQLKKEADLVQREQHIAEFNLKNRYRKRGISMTPMRYGVGWLPANCLVNVFSSDGTVLLTHAGSEIGQGINIKLIQVASMVLSQGLDEAGVPMHKIEMSDQSSDKVPNMTFTGGSTASESGCQAVRQACQTLNERLEPVKQNLRNKSNGKNPSWQDVVATAGQMNINLSAESIFNPPPGPGGMPFTPNYNIYGTACSEVELDCLTGEVSIQRVDLLYDCGNSLNPAIDVGQCEGAFMMGVGFYLREDFALGRDGNVLTNSTWNYKPPLASDVPIDWRVRFSSTPFADGIFSSKASGEPPLVLATSVMMAARAAVAASRASSGLKDWFDLNCPATPDVIRASCGIDDDQLLL